MRSSGDGVGIVGGFELHMGTALRSSRLNEVTKFYAVMASESTKH